MTKTHPESGGVEEEEEGGGCESSRGKESKFVAERSESGMGASDVDAKGGDGSSVVAGGTDSKNSVGGGGGDDGDGSSGSNDISGSNRERGLGRSRYRVPSNLCRDYIFYTCKRKDCKFAHPDADTEEYKNARASRPDLVMRDRERDRERDQQDRDRSRSPIADSEGSGSGGGSRQMVCRDYLRNVCFRGKDCKYAHPSDGCAEDIPWPQLCIDYRSGSCKRSNCRFMHYRTADGEYYMQTGTVSKELWQQFVALTLRDSKIIKTRPVCKQFLMNGSCTMDVCRYRHVSEKEYEDDMYYTLLQMVYETCRKFNPDLHPPNRNQPPPRDGDMPPPPPSSIHKRMEGGNFGGPPPSLPHTFRDYDHHDGGGGLRSSAPRRDFEWDRNPYGYPKAPDMGANLQVDQLTRENSELRRVMGEDNTRFKVEVERIKTENGRLQDQLNFAKSNPDQSVQMQQLNLLQAENTEYLAKVKSINDWCVELQAKYSTARREGDELRDSVKVLNLELATVNEEKIKLKRKSDELEAKLQVSQAAKEEANLAVEKKEYLEAKMKQYYEGMKRCEAEFTSTLEKQFHITTPNVMSYFPSWGYLMSFVTEIVTQINSLGAAAAAVAAAPAVSSYTQSYGAGGYGYGSSSGSLTGNYTMPPPAAGAYSTAGYQDYSSATQYPGTQPTAAAATASATSAAMTSGNAYGASASAAGSNNNGFYGNYGTDASSYNNTSQQYAGYGNSSSTSSNDKSRSSTSSSSKKDSMHNPPPWKKRA